MAANNRSAKYPKRKRTAGSLLRTEATGSACLQNSESKLAQTPICAAGRAGAQWFSQAVMAPGRSESSGLARDVVPNGQRRRWSGQKLASARTSTEQSARYSVTGKLKPRSAAEAGLFKLSLVLY